MKNDDTLENKLRAQILIVSAKAAQFSLFHLRHEDDGLKEEAAQAKTTAKNMLRDTAEAYRVLARNKTADTMTAMLETMREYEDKFGRSITLVAHPFPFRDASQAPALT